MKRVGSLFILLFASFFNTFAQSTAPDDWRKGVYYEIFVRSFYDSNADGIGDFRGITQKLDYLNDGNPETKTDLGISGIWLMPINASPSYHGYDVSDYYAVNPEYGTMADFKELITEAHKRNIKVVMDFVMNHSSTKHTWYQKARAGDPFYKQFYIWSDERGTQKGPWGQRLWHSRETPFHYGIFSGELPDLNYEFPPVQDSLFASAKFWIKEIGVDGFRLDAVKYLYEEGEILEDHPKTFAFWKQFGDSVRAWNPNAFTVAEAWTSTEKIVPYVAGKKLDYAFEFDSGYAMVRAVKNKKASEVYTQIQKTLSYLPEQNFGLFLTNHDQSRVIDELGDDLNKAKSAAALLFTLPGIPYVYYGEELGMTGSKPDKNIRLPMAWDSTANGGFSRGNPWAEMPKNWQTRNVAVASKGFALLSDYRRLIDNRVKSKALSFGTFVPVPSANDSIVSFLRTYEDETIWVVINLDDKPITIKDFSFDKTTFAGKSVKLFPYPASAKKEPFVMNMNKNVRLNKIGAHQTIMYRMVLPVDKKTVRN